MGEPTYKTSYDDVPGMIAQETKIASDAGINIGTMTVTRTAKGEQAIMKIETDD